ncbi:hypothetical protein AMJ80_09400 [bacterium SM23_31]|nr:MAG: hypothetical protein AMJ80_09400 [bacterium SM23_31]
MDCIKKIEEICDRLGEDIDSEWCKKLKEHLKDCPVCCAYVDTIKKTVELYKVLPEADLSEEVQERLRKTLKLSL